MTTMVPKKPRQGANGYDSPSWLRPYAEYGDAPEQADVHGGTTCGKHREAASRMAERESEKITSRKTT
jgi:hypothetical protein